LTRDGLNALLPDGWGPCIGAASLTWVATALIGIVVSWPFSWLRYVVPFTESSVIGSVWFLLDGIAHFLKLSFLISWIPLIAMLPVVYGLCRKEWDRPLVGVVIGAVVGPMFLITVEMVQMLNRYGIVDFSRIAAHPMIEIYAVCSIIGAIMGGLNLVFVRLLRQWHPHK
jgi:hypothetical protein